MAVQVYATDGLKDFAYNIIKEKLLGGVIGLGERIREDILAKELGVSRTPVREAINRLVTQGLVVEIPRKGLFAAEFSTKDILDALDVRTVLECKSVRLCCERITEEQAANLEKIYEQYVEAITNHRFLESSRLDAQMHKMIVSVSENKKLFAYIDDLEDFFTYVRLKKVQDWNSSEIERAIGEHRRLLDAIRNHKADLAAQMMENDMNSMKSLVKEREG
ncbi:MAG: GntR family transcriptional regulator [Fusobacteriaceae bacterium]|nr:GntR family transcriptional regulator [Fusobacteriaceae bacterium]